jgi:hypothetical protein
MKPVVAKFGTFSEADAATLSVCESKFACLACVLWLLWAAPPLAGQQAVI